METARSDLLIVAGALLAVLCVNGAYLVFVNCTVAASGISTLFFIAVTSAASAALCLPVAVCRERKRWPGRIAPATWLHLAVVGVGGSAVFQELSIQGMQRTSPAITAAMLSLSPGIIFVISAWLKLEKVDMASMYMRAKILGVAMCLVGAITMSLLQNGGGGGGGTRTPAASSANDGSYLSWNFGCLLSLSSVLVHCCSIVLQAVALKSIPAPVTVCVMTWAMASLSCPLLQLVLEGRIGVGSDAVTLATVGEIIVVGGIAGALYTTTMFWSIAKKGPVFVSVFYPVMTVSSGVLSTVLFSHPIGIGSIVGMVILFLGLYVFLWGKSKETNDACTPIAQTSTSVDVEEPLLS